MFLYTTHSNGIHSSNHSIYSKQNRVKIAVDRRTEVRVAIKIMDKGEIRAQEFTAQVRREIYIMRCLKHRHIVRMIEVLTSDTKLYIVMELVTGGELFDRIEKGRVTEDKARQYFQQLVDGVDFCHKKGVAHRDLKPENLLLDDKGDIKITDFGFSSMKGMDVSTGLLFTQCGTPDYCAPEIIDNAQKGYTGSKVDAWSCGIILYALLCGRLPFQEPDTEKLYDLILACRVRYPPFISVDARDLLENLLVRDPNKRFDLYKVKRHPWFLINYTGDDAKLIKKRPFYKNQPDPHTSTSTPSSPMVSARDPTPPSSSSNSGPNSGVFGNLGQTGAAAPDHAPLRISAPDTALTREHEQPPASPYRTMQPTQQQLLPAPSSAQIPSSSSTSSQVNNVTTSSISTTPSPLPPNQQQPLMDAGTPRNIHAGSNITSRMRDDPYGSFRPQSPATDPSMHGRLQTPPVQDVFTKVEVRPATPAQRQHSASSAAAFQAAIVSTTPSLPSPSTNASDHHVQPSLVPSASAGAYKRAPTPTLSSNPSHSNMQIGSALKTSASADAMRTTAIGSSGGGASRTRLSPTPPSSSSHAQTNGSLDSSGFAALGTGHSSHDDGSCSDPDSVEDYENKPAPLLDLPANPRQMMRAIKDGRRPVKTPPTPKQQKPPTKAQAQAQAHAQAMLKSPLPVSQQPRQRSDLTGTAFLHTPIGVEGSTSLSSIRPRRKYGRDGPNSGSLIDQRTHRLSRTDMPNSPPVVYSPSPVGNHYERFRSVSPGFARTNGSLGGDDGGPSSGHSLRMSGGGQQQYGQLPAPVNLPWKSSSSIGYGSLRDDASASGAGSAGTSGNNNSYSGMHSGGETPARLLWALINKLRGTSEPVNQPLSKELRKDYNALSLEVRQMKNEELGQMLKSFLTLFEMNAFSDVPALSPVVPNTSAGRAAGHDDDFTGVAHDGESGSQHGPSSGDYSRHLNGNALRRAYTGTDISSEEEPLSLSPVRAESTGAQLSDYARRRNLSDLLSKWMKSTEQHSENHANSAGAVASTNSQALVITNGHDEDDNHMLNISDLHKLVVENQSGRQESNLAEELLRLMSSSDDANSTSTFGPGSSNNNNHNSNGHNTQPGQSPPPPHVQPTRSHDSYTQATRYHSNMSNASGVNVTAVGHTVVNWSPAGNHARPSDYVPGRFKEPNNMTARARTGPSGERLSGLSGRTDVQRLGTDELSTSNSTGRAMGGIGMGLGTPSGGNAPNSAGGGGSGTYMTLANSGGGNVFESRGSRGSGIGIGRDRGDRDSSRMSHSTLSQINGVGSSNANGTASSHESASHMANSMGMHDVPYYMSDRRGGMANKLRGVLQTMKAKNHRLGELNAQFKSRLPADEILRLLARVLQDMGGSVTVKKETKRKMKCQLELKPNCMLHAGIELVELEDGSTCVAFRRSKADRGRTDTESFHTFFMRVRTRFDAEANATYPQEDDAPAAHHGNSPGKLKISRKGAGAVGGGAGGGVVGGGGGGGSGGGVAIDYDQNVM